MSRATKECPYCGKELKASTVIHNTNMGRLEEDKKATFLCLTLDCESTEICGGSFVLDENDLLVESRE